MQNNFPWYDSRWLSSYVQAKKIIKLHYPTQFYDFIHAIDVLRTRPDFETKVLTNVLDKHDLQEVKSLIEQLQNSALEKQELFHFGRLLVHDHPYFNKLQQTFVERISEIAQEPVEAYYNFLSLYNNLGICNIHMDAPYAKWTLDICVDQSEVWPIYFSEVQPWPENFTSKGNDWSKGIKEDPGNTFSKYELNPGDGLVFSGSCQWHYRERILQQQKNNYCHLIFFHFIPKGMRDIIEPSSWAGKFDMPALAQLPDGNGFSSYSLPKSLTT